ncbi:hypothetical protein NT2_08_01260 [Caenibius tardaugens NBRC 16725]|uniref:DUF1097 domain-containing protein n=1 Tax=Caenibius tardaugens NBRC 16725 TaxID=1219035 RepID=U2ZYA5_9SPHN|nr:hypothetical protein [Caenibius tardaugens]AZI35145.1 hypothetical protein EGO55_03535 [Caenibius tardaugens NBRC 16725]GAD50339.1 hypothetical protein NT2_08_01260 [Caenibius tardaugens NBRC 16725]
MASVSDPIVEEAPAAQGLTPAKGFAVLIGVIVAVAALIGIGVALELSALYAGFLFALYWTGLCHADFKQFVPALVGSLGGLGLAYGLSALPVALGGAGMALALALVLLAIYAIIMGWVPVLVNNAFMLFLTVGSIPVLHEQTTLGAMAWAVVVAAVYLGALVMLGKKLAARQAPAA